MFTGLVQAKGFVERTGELMRVRTPLFGGEDAIAIGESIAVNGCCLTVVRTADGTMDFELSLETLRRTALGELKIGSFVNLERAMRPMDRYGGHYVLGHVDATAEVVSIQPERESWRIGIRTEESGARYLIDKGSIALDGVSLTVVEPIGPNFFLWIIPHTYNATTIGSWVEGARINVEYDVLAKHVERLLAFQYP